MKYLREKQNQFELNMMMCCSYMDMVGVSFDAYYKT